MEDDTEIQPTAEEIFCLGEQLSADHEIEFDLYDVEDGNAQMQKAYRDLGVSMFLLLTKQNTTDEVLTDAVDAIAAIHIFQRAEQIHYATL
jgi:hypothetical protein